MLQSIHVALTLLDYSGPSRIQRKVLQCTRAPRSILNFGIIPISYKWVDALPNLGLLKWICVEIH